MGASVVKPAVALTVGATSLAVKPLIFAGKQVARKSKRSYLKGTMGDARGEAAFTVMDALNSPIVNEFGAVSEWFAAAQKSVFFSQVEPQGGSLASSYAQGNRASVVRPQSNSYQAAQLKIDLQQQTCRSLFTRDGELTKSAIDNARVLLKVKDFDKRAPIYKELSRRGNIEDWFKYQTDKFHSHGVDIGLKQSNPLAEVHFYKNAKTGEVYYGMDFKVIIDVAGQARMTVQEFLNSLPKEWRPTF